MWWTQTGMPVSPLAEEGIDVDSSESSYKRSP
jgi:hypothetical protein